MKQDFQEICKKLNISPSITRKQIYNYLDSHRTHPTVDEIYHDLVVDLHTLSKTTVYNVLKLFIRHNLVNVINTTENEKRYEINDMKHSHFLCKVCNKLYDIPQVTLSYDKSKLSGFSIEDEQVTLIGICPNCMRKQKKIN